MTIAEFNSFEHDVKDEVVLHAGNFLNNYDQDNEMCDVYELYDFFVKFCYDLTKNDKPEITAFSILEGFQPFPATPQVA